MILDIIANIGQAALKFFAATGRIALFTIQAVRWTILPLLFQAVCATTGWI